MRGPGLRPARRREKPVKPGSVRRPRLSVLGWGLIVFLVCSAITIPLVIKLGERLDRGAGRAVSEAR